MRVAFSTVSCCVMMIASAFLLSGNSSTAQEATKKKNTRQATKYRRLVPGVETTIAIVEDGNETRHTHDILEMIKGHPNLKWKPKQSPETRTLHAKSLKVTHYQNVWNLEFTFKPLRMMYIDLPQPNRNLKKKLIWYMVYRVKNNGRHFNPVRDAKGDYEIKRSDNVKVHFIPQFWLEPKDTGKMELIIDQVIPAAIPMIQKREDPNRKLLSTVAMSKKFIPLSTKDNDNSVWGVVTWENVDPELDYFSIYVRGLTNAYRWVDATDDFKPGDPVGKGRTFTSRTLKLNFWRPGDAFDQDEREVRIGFKGKKPYEWVWRPALSSSKKKSK